MPRMTNVRIVVAAAVGTAAVAALAIVLAGGSDGGEGPQAPVRTQRATLVLERAEHPAGHEELIVSLRDERLNTPATAGGASSVLLTCVDDRGRVTIRERQPWPLQIEPGYPPHAHQPAEREILDSLRRCRLLARGIEFEGRVSGRLPVLQPAA